MDHAPGSEIRIDGVSRAWVRTESGGWIEVADSPSPRTWLQRLRGLLG